MVEVVWDRTLKADGVRARLLPRRTGKHAASVADSGCADVDVESTGSMSIWRSSRLAGRLHPDEPAVEALGDWLPGSRAA